MKNQPLKVIEEYLFEDWKHFLIEIYYEWWEKKEHKRTEFKSEKEIEEYLAKKNGAFAKISW